MCAQKDKFDKTSLDKFAHEISADVNVMRKFSAHWIFTHGNTGQIILNFSPNFSPEIGQGFLLYFWVCGP